MGYLIGYNGNKIYRIWDPDKDVILTSSNVNIVEDFGDLPNDAEHGRHGSVLDGFSR
jgi:hypothetical protein